MTEEFLYDDVFEWANGKSKKVEIGLPTQGLSAVDRDLTHYREKVRNAQRFVLDDDFVERSFQASLDLGNVKHWINLARLPYPITWIEFDAREKVKIMHKHGTVASPMDLPQVSPRLGLLCTELDADSGLWVAVEFGYSIDKGQVGGVFPNPIAWLMAPEGASVTLLRPPKPWRLLTEMFPVFPRGIEAVGIGATDETAKYSVVFVPWVENRIQIVMEPIWQHTWERHREVADTYSWRKEVEKHMHDMLMYTMQEDRGLVRWFVTVLAMLNAAPNVKHVVAPKAGHRFRHFKNIPYLRHNLITLKLPKSKPITKLMGILTKAAEDRRRNRAHMVRGHFKVVEYGKKVPFKCDHVPTMVENGLGICVRCERLIRWVPSHARGDAELGWVQHDYVVEAS